MIELIGYLATIFVILSFLVKDMKTLRILNSVACATWILYGILITSYPVIITNIGIMSTHIIWFVRTLKSKK